ncbi:MAG TPA: hypothetical protein VMT11_06755 [Myxococcaceae bacterium]|nr:hypothetical protein [Myxococcaceae bacterium]
MRRLATQQLPTGDVHDFDFLDGEWVIQNRFLRSRLTGDPVWEEFPARSRVELRLGGLVNVDQIEFPTRGLTGMTVRLFDARERRWAIHWTDSRRAVLFPPVLGGFDGDRGLFYGEDTEGDRPVQVRFVWERRPGERAHWEQAFSLDGRSWETNWAMDFSRPR